MDLTDKLILITGASSGIGRACAELLGQKGASLILLARNKERLDRVCSLIKEKNGNAVYYSIDLTQSKELQQLSGEIIATHGVPDIIINSAGAGRWLSLDETPALEFEEMIASPLLATANISKAFLEGMKKRNSGHIITLNSVACFFTFPGANGYITARWALYGFMNALYEDLYKSDINVSMLAAGKVDSPYFKSNPGSADRIPKIALMLSRTLSVEDVANTVLKLIKSPKKTLIIPQSLAFLVWLNRFFPRIISWFMRKTSYKEV